MTHIQKALVSAVGPDNVSIDPDVLESYSHDYSLVPPGMPSFVVFPEKGDQVRDIVKACNQYSLPITPCSSKVHFHGCTIPKQGGVILDLKRMNRIQSINERNRYVVIEPGVTWGQVQSELAERELMVCPPLLPHPDQSVVTTFLEREPLVISLYEYDEPLMSMEVVWPDGSVFRTGSASAPNFPKTFVEGTNPMGPGTLDFFRLLQGAQGTMGIVTWAIVKAEYLAPESRPFFMGFEKVEQAIEPLYRIQRKKIGYECFLMNRLELACILAGKGNGDLDAVKRLLPEWIILVILRSARRRLDEKFAYEKDALKEIRAEFFGLDMVPSLPGLPNSGDRLADMLRKPHSGETYWRHLYQGNCQRLFFITKMNEIAEFVNTLYSATARHAFPPYKVGCYIQPINNGRACHCEFDFFYNDQDRGEADSVNHLTKEVAKDLLNQGALFTRPYGQIADLVYEKTADYTAALKKVKTMFDPNNILNPGNLCF